MVVQWLEFTSPIYEQLYWEHFTRAYLRMDRYVCIVNIFFALAWITRIWRVNPWYDTLACAIYMCLHICQFVITWREHSFYLRHRHTIVTIDRITSSIFLAQGQWRLIKLSGLTHDWDAVVANVLGFGTATMLAWHAIMHRLPYNRNLALSLLQFCLLVGTNGMIVDAMHTEFGHKLEAGADTVNGYAYAATSAFGASWPRFSGTFYFAVLFCGARQLIAFFYIAWFMYTMEASHRRAFLMQYDIDPDTCGFSHATRFDAGFLVANVLVVTGTMTNDLLGLYEYQPQFQRWQPSAVVANITS